jgi:hypothetical protein
MPGIERRKQLDRRRLEGETLSDGSTEQGERTVWQPTHAVSGQGAVRVIGPTQDATAAAIYAELLEIGERSLGDRATAERLVSGLFRANGQLVAAACHTVDSAQREAAKSELARMVRRAALDALPPVTTAVPTTESTTAKAPGRKLRPVVKAASAIPVTPTSQGARRGIPILLLALSLVSAGIFLLGRDLWSPSDQLADTTPADAGATVAAADPGPRPADSVAPTAAPAGQEDALEHGAAPPGDLLKLEAEEPGLGPLAGRIGTTTSGTAQGGTPQPDDAVPASAAADLRVFILYPDGAEQAAGELYATLSDSGEFPLVVLRDVEFAIATPRIRFFYPEDGDSANALADVLEPPSDGDDQWTVQDFTQFRPLPAPGTLEIFIPAL